MPLRIPRERVGELGKFEEIDKLILAPDWLNLSMADIGYRWLKLEGVIHSGRGRLSPDIGHCVEDNEVWIM